jgi:hypothetical protein
LREGLDFKTRSLCTCAMLRAALLHQIGTVIGRFNLVRDRMPQTKNRPLRGRLLNAFFGWELPFHRMNAVSQNG